MYLNMNRATKHILQFESIVILETLDAFQTGPAVPQIANAVLETVRVLKQKGIGQLLLVHPWSRLIPMGYRTKRVPMSNKKTGTLMKIITMFTGGWISFVFDTKSMKWNSRVFRQIRGGCIPDGAKCGPGNDNCCAAKSTCLAGPYFKDGKFLFGMRCAYVK